MEKQKSKAYISVISETILELKDFSLTEMAERFYNIFKFDDSKRDKRSKKSKLRFPVERESTREDACTDEEI